jgi:hypothetical protein
MFIVGKSMVIYKGDNIEKAITDSAKLSAGKVEAFTLLIISGDRDTDRTKLCDVTSLIFKVM